METKQAIFKTVASCAAGFALAISATAVPAKAATAYFFYTSSSPASSNGRLIEDITNGSPDYFFGTFNISDITNPNKGAEVTSSVNYNSASIYYGGKPTTGQWINNPASGTYNGTSYSYYNGYTYNRNGANTGLLYFWYSANGSTVNGDSLRLTVNLYQGGGFMKITNIDWCQGGGGSGGAGLSSSSYSTCNNQIAWALPSSNSSATYGTYIQVPSPSIALGLVPLLLLAIRRKKHIKRAEEPNEASRPSDFTQQVQGESHSKILDLQLSYNASPKLPDLSSALACQQHA